MPDLTAASEALAKAREHADAASLRLAHVNRRNANEHEIAAAEAATSFAWSQVGSLALEIGLVAEATQDPIAAAQAAIDRGEPVEVRVQLP